MKGPVSVATWVALGGIVVVATMWSFSATRGQEVGEAVDPLGAEARATARAVRRAEREALRLDPVARQTARAAHGAEDEERVQPVEIRDPVPLPVEVRNVGALPAPGKPAGGACAGTDVCTLRATANVREVLVVTAVWSATRIQCDDLVAASPANGAVISPWWRCQRGLLVEGPGAGFAGFVVVQ